MPDILQEAVREATQAYTCAWVSGGTSHEDLVRVVLEAALPHLPKQTETPEGDAGGQDVSHAVLAPIEAIEAALREHMHLKITRTTIEHAQRGWPIRLSGSEAEDAARIAVDALTKAGLVVIPAALLDDLTDPDECWFDHHGGCQAHGLLSLEPGERCPHAAARELLAALPEEKTDA